MTGFICGGDARDYNQKVDREAMRKGLDELLSQRLNSLASSIRVSRNVSQAIRAYREASKLAKKHRVDTRQKDGIYQAMLLQMGGFNINKVEYKK